jgi:hypothetical protein
MEASPSVAVRLAGVDNFEYAHAGKPDCYDAVFAAPVAAHRILN